MHEIAFAAACRLKTDARTARLKRLTVRTRGNFAKLVRRGQPDFYVVGFCGGKAHISCAQQNRSIVKAEFLQNHFGIANQSLVLLITFFRVGKFEKLNFLELMLVKNAPCIFTGRACFGAEASRPGGKEDRKLAFRQRFAAIKIVKLDFRRGREPEVGALYLEEIGSKFWKLAGTHERSAVH